MAVLAIGGSGRGAGKTAVGCALIAAMPELRWVAAKVSPHAHAPEKVWAESDRTSEKDTGRYLRAGAETAVLISPGYGDAAETWLRDFRQVSDGRSLVVESNSVPPGAVAWAEEPVLSLAVLAGAVVDWKDSFRDWASLADALVLTGGVGEEALPPRLRKASLFSLNEGSWFSTELAGFVRGRLGLAEF